MRFLADENFSKPLVRKIQSLGHSVKTVQQKNLQGSSDKLVSNIAHKEKRLIITFDKNFLKGKILQTGLVIFDFPKVPTQDIIPLIENFINSLQQEDLSQKKVFKFNKNGLEEIKNRQLGHI